MSDNETIMSIIVKREWTPILELMFGESLATYNTSEI